MRFERPNAMTFASQASTGAFWNKLLTKLEAAIDDIQNQVTDLAAVQADLAAAQADIVAVQADQATQLAQIIAAQAAAAAAAADAATAQSTATSAQGTADTVKASDAITASYVAPGLLLGGIDAGTDASIVVTNHTRHYGDSTTASLLSATITGLSYNTTYYVYYDDSSRTGGTVTYHATTDPKTALPNAAAGRHFVGSITTPSATGPYTSGGFNPPPAGGTVGQAAVL